MKYSPATLLLSRDKETHAKGQRQHSVQAVQAICKPQPSWGLPQLSVQSGEVFLNARLAGVVVALQRDGVQAALHCHPVHPARPPAASAACWGGLFGLSHLPLPSSACSGSWGSPCHPGDWIEHWEVRNSRYKAKRFSPAQDGLLLTPRASEVGATLMFPAVTQKNEGMHWCEAEQHICSAKRVSGNKSPPSSR